MSIINDALKKTQQNMSPDGNTSAPQEGTFGAAQGSSPKLGDERFAKPPVTKSGGPAIPPTGHQPHPLPQKGKKKTLPPKGKNRTFLGIGLVMAVLLALAAGLSKFFGQWPFSA
ncbi:MAG: hypothetical protein WC450_07080, partial [Candidatus Omnitrophota bacterium]